MRRYAAAEVSLDEVARVCRAFDVTLNDVALAAITDAFRAVLIGRGEKPQRNSLRTLVPVSVRSNDHIGKVDNRVSLMLPYLPVEKSDPEDQLRTVHSRMTRAKGSGQRQAGHIFVSAGNIIPFPLTAWAVRAATRLPQRGVVTVATNVPGPRQTMQIMGRKVVRMYPVPPIALGLRTGIAIVSYADKLVFGITGDYDTAPDIDDIACGTNEQWHVSQRYARRPNDPHRKAAFLGGRSGGMIGNRKEAHFHDLRDRGHRDHRQSNPLGVQSAVAAQQPAVAVDRG
jgi:diacylglycerol O-acyltransferase